MSNQQQHEHVATNAQNQDNELEQVYEDDLLLFRYRRPMDQDPLDELIVERQPRKRFKKENEDEEITKICHDFQSKMKLNNSVQYFLKRVALKQALKPHEKYHEELLNKVSARAKAEMMRRRQKIMNGVRGINEEPRVKVLELEEGNFVEFEGKKVKVQNLGPLNEDYYVLKKRNCVKNGTRVMIPEEAEHLFQKISFEQISETKSELSNDDDDSNRESNSDYDYPEEDHHFSDSDEGIIGKQYYPGCSDDMSEASGNNEDEEELYRKYLKSCKKAEQHDDLQYFEC